MKRRKLKPDVRQQHTTRHMLLACTIFTLTSVLFACSEDYKYKPPTFGSTPHDPSKPVEVSAILPDSGGYKSLFVIQGKNFGSDLSKIKVVFDEIREASLVSTNGELLYGVMPKQSDGNNKISVFVNDKEVEAPFTFRYTRVEQVTTISGQAGTGGYVDGTLAESRFNYMYGVGALTGNNLIVSEGRNNRVRMVSIDDNRVTTLYTGYNFGSPAVTKDRKRAYLIQLTKPHAIYYFSQEYSWAAKRLTSTIPDINGEIFACALDDDEKHLYFRDQEGKFGRIEIENPEKVEILNENCGMVDKNVSYLAWNPVEKCFYMSVQNSQGIYKVSHDGKTVEQYAGFNGVGGTDGPRLSASMKNPTGMAFDGDGNLYFTDSMGFTLRMINRTDGMCTTVAGKYTSEGGDDGPPLESTFAYPYDVCSDDNGDFYIAQGWGCTVRKFAIE